MLRAVHWRDLGNGAIIRRMSALERRAAFAWGVCLISVLFIVESAVAHRHVPSPWSVWVWFVLGIVAAGSAAVGLISRRKARSRNPGR